MGFHLQANSNGHGNGKGQRRLYHRQQRRCHLVREPHAHGAHGRHRHQQHEGGMDTRSEGTMPAVLSDAPAGWAYDRFELTESSNVRNRAIKQHISSREIRDHGEEALNDSSTTCTSRSCFSRSSPPRSSSSLIAKYSYDLKIRLADVTKIESSHMIDPSWNSGFKRFFSQHSIFWFRSDLPLSTELSRDATDPSAWLDGHCSSADVFAAVASSPSLRSPKSPSPAQLIGFCCNYLSVGPCEGANKSPRMRYLFD
ncbi:hypothetical protein PF008_g11039 [Phytophthora fragariae]|uniref:Uncharacterized protein n=1 Tax=Phytophthora fragariae TaxID=53985 RepID=A0A6G0RRW7_9STRA|nr:hypothetical protein PF008_g11039 [Phytophthora fragariae]